MWLAWWTNQSAWRKSRESDFLLVMLGKIQIICATC